MPRSIKSPFLLALFLALLLSPASSAAQVEILRTPSDGLQPQALIDPAGVLHLIYYQGESSAGDLFYLRRKSGQAAFSKPIQVNTRSGSAIAAGTIRGAQLALGPDARVHVAWNGHPPKPGAWMQAPMLYTRLNDQRTAFESERDLITTARGLDGGGSVAADQHGNVYVFWHAPKPGNTNGEAGRALFMARSTDDGKTFGPETLASPQPTGACGCCGMKAFADSRGHLFALYRSASEHVNRDETLLLSKNHGADFEVIYSHRWKIPTCPMSSAFLSETSDGILAAAETHGRVFYIHWNLDKATASEPVSPPQKAKYPVAIANQEGHVLLVWAEDTAWARGGSIAWQIYDPEGQPTPEKGRAEGLPAWSLPTAVPNPNNTFTIIY